MNFVIPSHMNYATHLSNMCSRPNTSCLNANFFTFFLFAKIKKKNLSNFENTQKRQSKDYFFFQYTPFKTPKKLAGEIVYWQGNIVFFIRLAPFSVLTDPQGRTAMRLSPVDTTPFFSPIGRKHEWEHVKSRVAPTGPDRT